MMMMETFRHPLTEEDELLAAGLGVERGLAPGTNMGIAWRAGRGKGGQRKEVKEAHVD